MSKKSEQLYSNPAVVAPPEPVNPVDNVRKSPPRVRDEDLDGDKAAYGPSPDWNNRMYNPRPAIVDESGRTINDELADADRIARRGIAADAVNDYGAATERRRVETEVEKIRRLQWEGARVDREISAALAAGAFGKPVQR
jgi:hypothetical protein